jgi:hypothetical protein
MQTKKVYPPEGGGGRGILPRSLVSINGAILSTPVSSYAAGARIFFKHAIEQEVTERSAKASINQSSRGSPGPSEIDVPLLRSADRIEFSWASQFIGSKADRGISATSASSAAKIILQPKRSTNINGDVLRERSYPINEPE